MRPDDAMRSDKPFDDLAGRDAWSSAQPRLPRYATGSITAPGLAAIHAGAGRAPRRTAASVDAPAGTRDNWRPIGPRNLGGRVRALAVDPADADRWYAGLASGGVHVTENAGRTWYPVWHEQTSLAVGALAVASDGRVYAATGEIRGGQLGIRGHGIWVSEDGGGTWSNPGASGSPPAANPAHLRGFDAVAVHPADPGHCWAAGGDGLFRSLDGGEHWTHLGAGEHWSDVVFADAGLLYLVRGTSRAGEAAVVRLDDPAAATDADLTAPANTSHVIAPGAPAHLPWPARGKLALAPSRQRLAYVRFAAEDGHHLGVFRTDEAAPAQSGTASAMTWERLADHGDWLDADDQGTYNLCIAVHPDHPERVAVGMVHVYVSTSARDARTTVTWRRAMHWALHDEGLREHHADNHRLVVAPDGALWVANDGGVARSENWADPAAEQVDDEQPLAVGAIRWEKRDLGITAAQMYDLNQSPLAPSILAAGLQDHGTFVTDGGLTWRAAFGGDGAFVVFDPDDPYRFLLSWYRGLESVAFPGHADLTFPGEDPDIPVRGARRLDDGFLEIDGPAFVADTDRHALDTGRLLHTRINRLYGTRSSRGERFEFEPVGRGIELLREAAAEVTVVEIAPTRAALRVGLPPGRHEARIIRDRETQRRLPPVRLSIVGRLPGPYALQAGDELRLTVDGTVHTIRFTAAHAADLGRATVAEVVAVIDGALGSLGLRALPRLWPGSLGIELVTRDVGSGRSITLGGSALEPLADGLSRLGVNAGTYRGTDDRPASVTLSLAALRPEDRDRNGDLSASPPRRLTVAIDGGDAREVTFAPPAFPDPSRIDQGQLQAALRAALDDDPVEVVATPVQKAVALVADVGASVVAIGTAADRLHLAAAGGELLLASPLTLSHLHADRAHRHVVTFDLHHPAGALDLTISDGTTTTSPLEVTASRVASLHAVTPEELHRLWDDHLRAHPGIGVRAVLLVDIGGAQASEIRFSTVSPDDVWIGGEDGSVHRSVDNGRTWRLCDGPLSGAGPEGSPALRLTDLGREVEAIGLHPGDPAVAFVGLFGVARGADDPGFLFRTRDGGETWQQVGAPRGVAATSGVATADGTPLPVTALEIDPAAPDVVFAATPAGVFRSGDGGATWAAFNEGLPNSPVSDLAFEPVTRTLRASAWGRGAFERRVGNDPPADVRVHVRAGALDVGDDRPVPASPALFADDPAPVLQASPDLKVSRRRPDRIGADETVDGVVFDLDIPDDPIVAGDSATLWVQIHNRGAFPARSSGGAAAPSVRVTLLRTRAVSGPPPLPVDLWTGIAATPTLAGDHGDWTVVLDRRLTRDLVGGVPAVVSEDVTFPADAAGTSVGLLAIVTADDDPVERTETDVVKLLATDRQTAYREIPVLTEHQDRRLLLRATGARPFVIDQPNGAATLAARLHFSDAQRRTPLRQAPTAAAPDPTYDLGIDDPLIVQEEPIEVRVDLGADRDAFQTATRATPVEIAEVVGGHLALRGAPAAAYPAPAGLRLRARAGARIAAIGGGAAARLNLPIRSAATAQPIEDTREFSFDLDTTAGLRLVVVGQQEHTVEVAFRPDLFRTAAFASPRDVAAVINRALREAGVGGLARAEVLHGVGLYGNAHAMIDVTGPAAGDLGLTRVGAAQWFRGDPGVVDATTLGELVVTVTPRIDIDPRAYPWIVPDPAAATPPQVRRLLNHAFRIGRLAVRAEIPRIELRVGRSTPDPSEGTPVTGGWHLAELVRSADPLAPADPDVRAGLFSTPLALENDRLAVGEDNALFLRVSNGGNLDAIDAEHRLFTVDMTSSPLELTPVGTAVTATVPAGGATVVPFTHRPDPGPDDRFLLAVSDPAGAARAVPPDVVDVDALVDLARQPGAALRHFTTR